VVYQILNGHDAQLQDGREVLAEYIERLNLVLVDGETVNMPQQALNGMRPSQACELLAFSILSIIRADQRPGKTGCGGQTIGK
jgi:hypothetical protein